MESAGYFWQRKCSRNNGGTKELSGYKQEAGALAEVETGEHDGEIQATKSPAGSGRSLDLTL